MVICAFGEDVPVSVNEDGASFLSLVNELTISVGGSDETNGVGDAVGENAIVVLGVAVGVGLRVGVTVGRLVGVTVGRNPPTPEVGVGVLVGVFVGVAVGIA